MADIARLHGDLLAAQAFQRLEFRLADEAPAAVEGTLRYLTMSSPAMVVPVSTEPILMLRCSTA